MQKTGVGKGMRLWFISLWCFHHARCIFWQGAWHALGRKPAHWAQARMHRALFAVWDVEKPLGWFDNGPKLPF
jgi:hypothetical protein